MTVLYTANGKLLLKFFQVSHLQQPKIQTVTVICDRFISIACAWLPAAKATAGRRVKDCGGREANVFFVRREKQGGMKMTITGLTKTLSAISFVLAAAVMAMLGFMIVGRHGILTAFELIAVLTLMAIMMTSAFGFFIVYRKARPLKNLAEVVDSVACGNLSFDFDRGIKSTDEVGILARGIFDLVDTINAFTGDLKTIRHELIVNGDIDAMVDASKYERFDTLKQAAESVNDMMHDATNDVMVLLDSLEKLSVGNFDIVLPNLPGKKCVLTDTVRPVIEILRSLQKSIAALAVSVANGDLGESLNTADFKGSWASLAGKLNELVAAVSLPLAAVHGNIAIMSNGDFSHLEGDYPGVYGELKDICNLVNNTTKAYISEITDLLQSIAGGNLTVKPRLEYVGSYAPIRTAIETILDDLNQTMADVQDTVNQVASGAKQISESSADLAMGSARQTASIEELHSAIAIVNQKAVQASQNSKIASQSADVAGQSVAAGNMAIQTMNETMKKIKGSSESISKIIDVITNIAFQTNLLALNASVEAARAGDHGKGFHVVADEVRSLAGRSQHSASETSAIVTEDLSQVAEGLKTTENVVNSFSTIAGIISEISGLIGDITAVSAEQLESISNINSGISEIAEVVTDATRAADDSAIASRDLSEKAEVLRQKVAFFKLRG